MKKLYILIVAIILTGLFISLQPKPKYVYVTQENITNNSDGSTSMDLWCYHEYSNKHIKKNYLETITVYTQSSITRFKSSQCRQTPNLY